MCEFDFAKRLTQLRLQKNVSAREMSLDIGQNPSYINNIENNKMLPSMTVFFYICDYLKISPKDFFDEDSLSPYELSILTEKFKNLTPTQMEHISWLIDDLTKK